MIVIKAFVEIIVSTRNLQVLHPEDLLLLFRSCYVQCTPHSTCYSDIFLDRYLSKNQLKDLRPDIFSTNNKLFFL